MKPLDTNGEVAAPAMPDGHYTDADAERISGLSARYIPFIPTPKVPTDDCAGHRCQLGRKSHPVIVVGYDGGVPITQAVEYFHLRAFGRTWAEALAHWKASKPTEGAAK